MKHFFTYFIIMFLSLGVIKGQLTKLPNGKQVDKRLTGEWIGSETDNQIDGVHKDWIMTRKKDGTFVLDFTFKKDGEEHNSIETGSWWIEDGKFYEAHSESGMTDIYTYEVLDKNHVKFRSFDISIDMNKEVYEFIDTRKNSDKKSNSVKDGSSFEKAIKVKSVAEEYKFVKENCKDCEMVSQSLQEHKSKKYDVLNLKKSDGSDITYYFDINSFYGKF